MGKNNIGVNRGNDKNRWIEKIEVNIYAKYCFNYN